MLLICPEKRRIVPEAATAAGVLRSLPRRHELIGCYEPLRPDIAPDRRARRLTEYPPELRAGEMIEPAQLLYRQVGGKVRVYVLDYLPRARVRPVRRSPSLLLEHRRDERQQGDYPRHRRLPLRKDPALPEGLKHIERLYPVKFRRAVIVILAEMPVGEGREQLPARKLTRQHRRRKVQRPPLVRHIMLEHQAMALGAPHKHEAPRLGRIDPALDIIPHRPRNEAVYLVHLVHMHPEIKGVRTDVLRMAEPYIAVMVRVKILQGVPSPSVVFLIISHYADFCNINCSLKQFHCFLRSSIIYFVENH